MIRIFRTAFRIAFSDNRNSKTCPESHRRIKNRKLVALVALVVAFAACGAVALAQQPKKVPRIGYLAGAGSGPAPAIIQGLRDLGYVEARTLVSSIEQPKVDKSAPRSCRRGSSLKVDVIVVDGSGIALAVKKPPAVFRLCWLPVPILLERDLSPAWPDPAEISRA